MFRSRKSIGTVYSSDNEKFSESDLESINESREKSAPIIIPDSDNESAEEQHNKSAFDGNDTDYDEKISKNSRHKLKTKNRRYIIDSEEDEASEEEVEEAAEDEDENEEDEEEGEEEEEEEDEEEEEEQNTDRNLSNDSTTSRDIIEDESPTAKSRNVSRSNKSQRHGERSISEKESVSLRDSNNKSEIEEVTASSHDITSNRVGNEHSQFNESESIMISSDEEKEEEEDIGTHQSVQEDTSSREEPSITSIAESDENQNNSRKSKSRYSIDFQSAAAVSSTREDSLNVTAEEIEDISLTEQKIGFYTYERKRILNEIAKSKKIISSVNMNILPDKGIKIYEGLQKQEKELAKIEAELKALGGRISDVQVLDTSPKPFDIQELGAAPPVNRELGKKGLATQEREQALTIECLQNLHSSLTTRPVENQMEQDPERLKIPLMKHQKEALAWLLWREQQTPSGGVLADDMGLGKTLTMISLILRAQELGRKEAESSDEDEDEWNHRDKKNRYKGHTLVICPASLVSQWESEALKRCKRGSLSVVKHHGNDRETKARKLAKHDLVITTYQLVNNEVKNGGVLPKIHWHRIILDEAHYIRNHKTKASEAVCSLNAKNRWALTGTPIQNKELDLYAILKFLRCSPFDEYTIFKRWVDNKTEAGVARLSTVMKTIMLRRTKQELMQNGSLQSLPKKSYDVIEVDLDTDENLVHEKIMTYSRTIFARILTQRAEKEHSRNMDAYGGFFDKNLMFTKAQRKVDAMFAGRGEVKMNQILVLLLRLRQVCCHPALVKAMLDQEDLSAEGEDMGGNLALAVQKMTLNGPPPPNKAANGDDDDDDIARVDERIFQNLLVSENPVFNDNRKSSKVRCVLAKVSELLEKGDKIIIVSQWTSMLHVLAKHLDSIKGATYSFFIGSIPVKDRQAIQDQFNDVARTPRILLLSLTAGGVGLNLVGANHLIFVDLHWNPQLESQAQDRIYRFGQTKDVFIYKFITKNTIEERIMALQEKKLGLAESVLEGQRKVVSNKLTLDDLKSLFGF